MDVAFSIRGEQPPSTWPESFDVNQATNTDAWTEERANTEGLVISAAYPAGWSARTEMTPTRLIVLYNESGTRAVAIWQPRRLPAPVIQPFTVLTIQKFADQMQARSAARFDRKGFGQGLVNDRWWVWLDLAGTELPPQVVQTTQDAFAGIRMWVMVTMIGSHEMTVMSHVLLPRTATAAETDEMIKQAGTDVFAMLKRISIRPQT